MSTAGAVSGYSQYYTLKLDATGLNLSTADFAGDLTGFKVLSSLSHGRGSFF